MKLYCAVAFLILLTPVAGAAQNKSKKQSEVSAAFAQARYVYVRAEAGDVLKPGLYPEDREAIGAVQDGIRDWNRYVIVTEGGTADLVFVVRPARGAGAQVRAGAPMGLPRQAGQQGQGHQPGQIGDDGPGVGVGAEVGPNEDMLQVFIPTHEGRMIGPIWNRLRPDGLDAPDVPLLRDLRIAVERAYPRQATPQKQP